MSGARCFQNGQVQFWEHLCLLLCIIAHSQSQIASDLASPEPKRQNSRRKNVSESPVRGRQKGVTPICSDFPVFFRFVPICAPCFREYLDLFRFVPICSDFFRFVFRTNQNKSGKPLSADPFCKSPNVVLPGLAESHGGFFFNIQGPNFNTKN